MTKVVVRIFLLLTLALGVAGQALAQADVASATVKGTVTDPQGSAVPNANVMIAEWTVRGEQHLPRKLRAVRPQVNRKNNEIAATRLCPYRCYVYSYNGSTYDHA